MRLALRHMTNSMTPYSTAVGASSQAAAMSLSYTNTKPIWFDDDEGRRHVAPYMYTFCVRVKGRWLGRTAIDVYTAEFTHHDAEYYKAAATEGRLAVQVADEGKTKSEAAKRRRQEMVEPSTAIPTPSAAPIVRSPVTHLLERCDIITHTIHKHELSVFSSAVPIVSAIYLQPSAPFYGIMVVNKPCSLPTHSSGRYHFNSCLSMLEAWLMFLATSAHDGTTTPHKPHTSSTVAANSRCSIVDHGSLAEFSEMVPNEDRDALISFARTCIAETGKLTIRACHRLDKATSGVLVCALTSEAAAVVGDLLASKTKAVDQRASTDAATVGDVPHAESTAAASRYASVWSKEALESFGILKTYVARVDGEFPVRHDAVPRDACTLIPLGVDDGADWAVTTPLAVEDLRTSHADDDERRQDNVKERAPCKTLPAVTLFRRLYYDSVANESVVECVPLTGRTHQIRLHLLAAGYPIANDAKYHPRIFAQRSSSEKLVYFHYEDLPKDVQQVVMKDPLCSECNKRLPVTKAGDFESVIYLHAWRYRVAWDDTTVRTFEVSLPTWATLV